MHLVFAILAYWVLLSIVRLLYLRRPGLAARQAQARAKAHVTERPGDRPGEHLVTYSETINLTPRLGIVLLPPALLLAVWLLLCGGS